MSDVPETETLTPEAIVHALAEWARGTNTGYLGVPLTNQAALADAYGDEDLDALVRAALAAHDAPPPGGQPRPHLVRNIEALRSLPPGWDSYGGKPPSEAALKALANFCIVPMSSGGVQVECHQDGWDIEIEIGSDGTLDPLVEHEDEGKPLGRPTIEPRESGVLRDPEPQTERGAEEYGEGIEAFVRERVAAPATPEGGEPSAEVLSQIADFFERDDSPEGGQLDPEEGLLAEADEYTQGAIGPSGTLYGLDLVPRLASALRRAAHWRDLAYARVARLERELAEARSHGEVLARGAITSTGNPDRAFVPRITIEPEEHPSSVLKGARVLVVLAPTEPKR